MHKAPHIDQILQVTVSRFGLTVDQLKRGRKTSSRVFARTLICGLCQEYTPISVIDLADILQIDHSTIVAGRKRHHTKLSNDLIYISYYLSIKQELGL